MKKKNIWKNWGIHSQADFEDKMVNFSFSSKVNDEIVKRFDLVKRSLKLCYEEYELLDMAHSYVLLSLEMALYLRHKEIEGFYPDDKKTLMPLVNWANSRSLIEDDVKSLESYVKLRNSIAHPKRDSQFGYLSFGGIKRTVDIINELYDDSELRRIRKREHRAFKKTAANLEKNGVVFTHGDNRIFIFRVELLRYENRITPDTYSFLFWPTFDPVEKDDMIDEGGPLILTAKGWDINNDELILYDFDNKAAAIFKPLLKTEDKRKFEEWQIQFGMVDSMVKFSIENQIDSHKMKLRHQANSIVFDESQNKD